MKRVLIIIIPLFFPSFVLADSFYPLKDTKNCEMIGVMGIEYVENSQNNVLYNVSEVGGEKTPWIRTHSFLDLATPLYPDAHRYSNIADFVSVPPNTQINYGVWFYNFSNHDIHVKNVDIASSLLDFDAGNITRLGALGTLKNVSFLFNGQTYNRYSRYNTVLWDKIYKNEINYLGQVIYSFTTIQPLKVLNSSYVISFEDQQPVIMYRVNIKNSSEYMLCGLSVTDWVGGIRARIPSFCIGPNFEKEIEYSFVLDRYSEGEIRNQGAMLEDPNRHIEYITTPQSGNLDRGRDTFPFIFSRNDSSDSSWYANQPGWGETGRGMGVELIPYSLQIPSDTYLIVPEIESEINVSDSDEVEVVSNTIQYPGEQTISIKIRNSGGYVKNGIVSVGFDAIAFELEDEAIESFQLLNGQEINISFKFKIKEEQKENKESIFVLDVNDGYTSKQYSIVTTIIKNEIVVPVEPPLYEPEKPVVPVTFTPKVSYISYASKKEEHKDTKTDTPVILGEQRDSSKSICPPCDVKEKKVPLFDVIFSAISLLFVLALLILKRRNMVKCRGEAG